MFSLDIRGVDELRKQVGYFADSRLLLEKPLKEQRGLITRMLATYPAQRRQKVRFVSARQRRAFFAKLRSGQIRVPYQRTNRLGKGWDVDVDVRGNNVSIEATNPVPYAELVQGRRQARMFRGLWDTAEEIQERLRYPVEDAIQNAINRVIAMMR